MGTRKNNYTKEILENKYDDYSKSDCNALYVTKNLNCDIYIITANEAYELPEILGFFKTRDEAYNYFKKNWDAFSQRYGTKIEYFDVGFFIEGYKFTNLSKPMESIGSL